MSPNYHSLPVTFFFMLQIQNIILIRTFENSASLEMNQNYPHLTRIPQKLQRDKNFYSQLSPFIPVEISVKKEVPTEVDLGIDETTEPVDEDLKKLTNIIENLFEPPMPLPSEEDYFPFLNESLPQANCTLNNSTQTCQGIILNAPSLDQTSIVKSVFLSVIAVFSYTGNIATLTSILRTGRQASSTVYMLLVQLTIADLLVTTFCILTDAVWMLTVQWYAGNFLCKVVKFMQMFSLYLSTFVLVLIGFDRLCAVRFPMGRARAKKDVRKGIVCIWTISAVFSSPQVRENFFFSFPF